VIINLNTSLTVRTGVYPLGFLPRVLGAEVIFKMCIASSSWVRVADAFEYSALAALDDSPCL